MNTLLSSKNWHDIAEVTLYTIITWEAILFLLYVLVTLGYPLEIGLAISWFLCGLLQIWTVKYTLPQFPNKFILLTLITWLMIPILLIMLYQSSQPIKSELLLLILFGGLIGQTTQFLSIKYTIGQRANQSLLVISIGWFSGCCLWLASTQIHQLGWQLSLLMASMITSGFSVGLTAYHLLPLSSIKRTYSWYRRYIKIKWLASIFLFHGIASLLMPPAHPASIQATAIKMETLAIALENYHLEHGYYPTTEQGLESLLGQYYDRTSLPKDSWHQNFHYRSDTKTYELISFGPDQRQGSEDDIILTSIGP